MKNQPRRNRAVGLVVIVELIVTIIAGLFWLLLLGIAVALMILFLAHSG